MKRQQVNLARRAELVRRRLVNVRARLARIYSEIGDMPTIDQSVSDAWRVVAVATEREAESNATKI